MIMTDANEQMSSVHDWMPVILKRRGRVEAVAEWDDGRSKTAVPPHTMAIYAFIALRNVGRVSMRSMRTEARQVSTLR